MCEIIADHSFKYAVVFIFFLQRAAQDDMPFSYVNETYGDTHHVRPNLVT